MASTITPLSSVSAGPSQVFEAVTPHDSTNLGAIARGLYVGVTGDVAAVPSGGGAAVLFKAVPAGAILPISVIRVNATGTTASQIVALF